MNRGSFFKKLFTGAAAIAVSPSILAEINTKSTTAAVSNFDAINRQLLTDLPFLQSQLPKMLMRDYIRKENEFWQDGLSKHII